MTQPTWPTIKEVANRLGVSEVYIHRMVTTGRIHAQMRGDVWLLDPESVRQYEATRRPKRRRQQTEQ